jgi:hypothetical protein
LTQRRRRRRLDAYDRGVTSLSERTLIGNERQQLEAFLDENRSELAGTLTGLTDEQARRRLVPSLTHRLGQRRFPRRVRRVPHRGRRVRA